MLRRRSYVALAAAILVAALTLLPLAPGQALAHERRLVAGKYQFVVGFLNEPAVANQMNGVDLRVTIPAENNKPVEGLERTLKVTVIVGGGAQALPLDLERRSGRPGAYAAHFMPTRAGTYIFHFSGTIEGTPIDERFESGPGRFSDVESLQALQFPDKLPDPAALAAEARAAREEAATARLLGLGGALAGVVGLAVGLVALLTRPRLAAAPARRPGTEEKA
jgi:hypothetical protein